MGNFDKSHVTDINSIFSVYLSQYKPCYGRRARMECPLGSLLRLKTGLIPGLIFIGLKSIWTTREINIDEENWHHGSEIFSLTSFIRFLWKNRLVIFRVLGVDSVCSDRGRIWECSPRTYPFRAQARVPGPILYKYEDTGPLGEWSIRTML